MTPRLWPEQAKALLAKPMVKPLGDDFVGVGFFSYDNPAYETYRNLLRKSTLYRVSLTPKVEEELRKNFRSFFALSMVNFAQRGQLLNAHDVSKIVISLNEELWAIGPHGSEDIETVLGELFTPALENCVSRADLDSLDAISSIWKKLKESLERVQSWQHHAFSLE